MTPLTSKFFDQLGKHNKNKNRTLENRSNKRIAVCCMPSL
jgi:hypothetical protein